MGRNVVRRVVAVMLLLRNVMQERVLDIGRGTRTRASSLLSIEGGFD